MEIALSLGLTSRRGALFEPDATLALDFTTGRYRVGSGSGSSPDFSSLPNLTVTRATPSVAYGTTSGGVLVPFAANVARITNQGLLVEEARTNLFLQSNALSNVSWTTLQASVTSGGTTAPDGSAAWKIVEDTSNNFHGIRQAATVVTATAYTYSVYLKAAERSWAYLELDDAASPSVYINLTTGAQGTAVAGFSSITVTNAGNGWWRVAVVRTTNGTSASCYITTATGDLAKTYTGNGTSGIYAFGAQFELGAFPTSYIPTTSASVTRAADSVSITLALPVNGTFYANALGSTLTTNPRVLGSDVNTGPIFFQSGTAVGSYNAATVLSKSLTITAGALVKSSVAWTASSRSLTANGLAPATDANGIGALTKLYLGSDGAAASFLNTYIQSAILYPRTDSAATQQALTT